jgi:DNA-directed RNA polymerase subunit F
MKIEIKIEGENLQEIVGDIIKLLEMNREEIKKLLEIMAEEAISVLNDKKIIEKGAELYIKLNKEINLKYREEK